MFGHVQTQTTELFLQLFQALRSYDVLEAQVCLTPSQPHRITELPCCPSLPVPFACM